MSALEELLAHPGIWRGHETGAAAAPARPSGFAQLDQALRGGWPRGQLTELIGGPFGCGETRVLLPTLASCTREQRRVVLVSPPAIPWIPGWRQMGVDPELLLLIRADTEDDAVWSCEQILRQPGTGALLAWLHGTDGAPLRRLRLATGTNDACAFLYRPPAAAQQPSPAHLRIRWQGAGDDLRLEIIKQTGGWPPRNQPVMIPRNLLNHRCDP
jgi:protein ImuA